MLCFVVSRSSECSCGILGWITIIVDMLTASDSGSKAGNRKDIERHIPANAYEFSFGVYDVAPQTLTQLKKTWMDLTLVKYQTNRELAQKISTIFVRECMLCCIHHILGYIHALWPHNVKNCLSPSRKRVYMVRTKLSNKRPEHTKNAWTDECTLIIDS